MHDNRFAGVRRRRAQRSEYESKVNGLVDLENGGPRKKMNPRKHPTGLITGVDGVYMLPRHGQMVGVKCRLTSNNLLYSYRWMEKNGTKHIESGRIVLAKGITDVKDLFAFI